MYDIIVGSNPGKKPERGDIRCAPSCDVDTGLSELSFLDAIKLKIKFLISVRFMVDKLHFYIQIGSVSIFSDVKTSINFSIHVLQEICMFYKVKGAIFIKET